VSVRAVARVILDVVAVIDDDGERCSATGTQCVEAGACAEERQVCRGDGISGTIPCCNPEFDCTTRSTAEARCQPTGAPLPPFYKGGVEQPDNPLVDCQDAR